jgi:hypothetical protein
MFDRNNKSPQDFLPLKIFTLLLSTKLLAMSKKSCLVCCGLKSKNKKANIIRKPTNKRKKCSNQLAKYHPHPTPMQFYAHRFLLAIIDLVHGPAAIALLSKIPEIRTCAKICGSQ